MANRSYPRRYSAFKTNGTVTTLPFISISERTTDRTIVFRLGETRLDKVSADYYNNPFYDFLILLANPQYGGLQWDIPDGAVIRIPYPLTEAFEEYQSKAKKLQSTKSSN